VARPADVTGKLPSNPGFTEKVVEPLVPVLEMRSGASTASGTTTMGTRAVVPLPVMRSDPKSASDSGAVC
jgi:hypothetical protein